MVRWFDGSRPLAEGNPLTTKLSNYQTIEPRGLFPDLTASQLRRTLDMPASYGYTVAGALRVSHRHYLLRDEERVPKHEKKIRIA